MSSFTFSMTKDWKVVDNDTRMNVGLPPNLPDFSPFRSLDEGANFDPYSIPFQADRTCIVCGAKEEEQQQQQQQQHSKGSSSNSTNNSNGSTENITKEGTVKKLSKCSRCSLVYYCGRDHQIQDFKNGHKEICRKIAKLDAGITQKQRKKEKDTSFRDVDAHIDYVQAEMDRLDYIYCSLHQDYKSKPLALVQEIVTKYTDVFTQNDTTHAGPRKARLPFLLLQLNRDSDAVRLCRYWFLYDSNDFTKSEDLNFLSSIDRAVRTCNEGDWCYDVPLDDEDYEDDRKIVENDILYDKWWEEKSYQTQLQMGPLLQLVVWIAKMKWIAKLESALGKYSIYMTETKIGKDFEDAGINALSIKSMVFGDDKTASQAFKDMKRLKKQVPVLLSLIHDSNPFILPALINPEPFFTQLNSDERYTSYDSDEIREAIVYTRDLLIHQVPGAMRYLQNCFGVKPTYYI